MKLFCKVMQKVILLFLFSLLTGCGAALNPYHEDFNCRAEEDDSHCVDTQIAYEEAIAITDFDIDEGSSQHKDIEEIRLQRLAELLEEPETPMIAPPRIMRVLILPYKGKGDELFMARYAYLQVESAKWVLTGIDEGGE
jgi:conjugal transfer pilus assembly protein TraV